MGLVAPLVIFMAGFPVASITRLVEAVETKLKLDCVLAPLRYGKSWFPNLTDVLVVDGVNESPWYVKVPRISPESLASAGELIPPTVASSKVRLTGACRHAPAWRRRCVSCSNLVYGTQNLTIDVRNGGHPGKCWHVICIMSAGYSSLTQVGRSYAAIARATCLSLRSS